MEKASACPNGIISKVQNIRNKQNEMRNYIIFYIAKMMKVSTDSSTFCPLNHLALHSKSIRKASTCPHGITIKVQIIGIKTSMPFMKVIRVSIDTPISYHILTKRPNYWSNYRNWCINAVLLWVKIVAIYAFLVCKIILPKFRYLGHLVPEI